MKEQIDRRKFLTLALVALPGCASLKSVYSTNAEQRTRGIAKQGAKVLQAVDAQHPYVITDSGILLTTTAYLNQVAGEKGIDVSGEPFYNRMLPGNGITIQDPSTGDKLEQLVSAAGTIDTKWGRVNVNKKTIDEVDAEIGKLAGRDMIVTQQTPSPYSTGTGIMTLGWARYFDPYLIPPSGNAELPVNLFNLMTGKGLGMKADYVAVAIPRGNNEDVYGILAFAPMNKIGIDGRYNMGLKSDENVVVGTRYTLFDNMRRSVSWINALAKDTTGVADSVTGFMKDLDAIEQLHDKPGLNDVQKAGNYLKDVQNATGAAQGVRVNVDALGKPIK